MKRQTKKDREDERVAMHRKSGKYEPSAKGRKDESKGMHEAMERAHKHLKKHSRKITAHDKRVDRDNLPKKYR